MIRAKVTSNWNPNIVEEITREAMENLAQRGRLRLSSITCPTHGSSHRVTWTASGETVIVAAENPCCDALQSVLDAAVADATR